jgi:hypothetical protein
MHDNPAADEWSPALPHLLLEQVPHRLTPSVTQPFHAQVVPLFYRCFTVENSRLALKIATTYKLTWMVLPDHQTFVVYVKTLFSSKAHMTPAVGLAMHFQVIIARYPLLVIKPL